MFWDSTGNYVWLHHESGLVKTFIVAIPSYVDHSLLCLADSVIFLTCANCSHLFLTYLVGSNPSGVQSVALSSDKGKRFGFPSGILGGASTTPIRCQAHADHWVQYQWYASETLDKTIIHTKDDDEDSRLYLYTNGTNLWVVPLSSAFLVSSPLSSGHILLLLLAMVLTQFLATSVRNRRLVFMEHRRSACWILRAIRSHFKRSLSPFL